MKIFLALLLALSFSTGKISAQYKTIDDRSSSSSRSQGNLLLGFIDPGKFSMRHSFNANVFTTTGGTVSLTSYINSMNYSFSKDLNVSADVKVQFSPFASSSLGTGYSSALQKNLSGIFLSRASVNYQISDNAFINLEYRRLDESDYYSGWNPYGYNGYNNSFTGFGLR